MEDGEIDRTNHGKRERALPKLEPIAVSPFCDR